MIGDSWLDIELGRGFRINTILVELCRTDTTEERDGIGLREKNMKSGPTFVAKSYAEIESILEDPEGFLYALEANNLGLASDRSMRMLDVTMSGRNIYFRSLARHQEGLTDKYDITVQYKEFNDRNRSDKLVDKLSKGVGNYLRNVKGGWNLITYVADKKTTVPPNKMKDLFDRLETDIEREELFEWVDNVQGSIRKLSNYGDRYRFVKSNLKCKNNINIAGKNIIVIDDQATTRATATAISGFLKEQGVNNILFLTLFQMVSNVSPIKTCPKCGKNMQIKMRKRDGNKFYSCTPPEYRGNGCGFTKNC
jgi:hypothetical protein